MCFKKLFTSLNLFCLLLICASAILISSCQTSKDVVKPVNTEVASVEDTLTVAKQMLKLDDFREFEKAEFRFISVRFWKMEDVEVAGWLAQLYVAWMEQLKFEISFMEIQLAVSENLGKTKDANAFKTLMNYRLSKFKEVEENARLLCNMLRNYYPRNYLTHRVMADYFRVMKDREKMEDRILLVKELNPDSVGLQFLQGAALAEFENNYIAAVKYYDKALERDPDFVKALYFKGLAFHHMGHEDFAKNTMEEVLQKSPRHPGAKAFLSAKEYSGELTNEVLGSVVPQNTELLKPNLPHLIYWVGNWIKSSPQLLYRIAAPGNDDIELQLSIALISNGNKVVQTIERFENLKADKFVSLEQMFVPPERKKWDTFEIVISLFAKKPGEDEFRLISVRRVALPNN